MFGDEARQALAGLGADTSSEAEWQRVVLQHNLGFNQDKDQRKESEKRLKNWLDDRHTFPLAKAYAGSLQMLKVAQRSKGDNAIRSIFGKSPKDEVLDGFNKITEAMNLDSGDVVIRFLHLTAALECLDFFPEMNKAAASDIDWLSSRINCRDTAQVFLFHLSRVKYYLHELRGIKKALRTYAPELFRLNIGPIQIELELARQTACCPFYQHEVALWERRIQENFPEYFTRTAAP